MSALHATPANQTVPQVYALTFGGMQSLGIYHAAPSELLIVMINGGAQTRTGSHRMQQQLACHWQKAGFASLRFDFPGFGDAQGQPADFRAHARYLSELPSQLETLFGRQRPVVLFGLCDGATAALIASQALKPKALLLLNPWCRLQQNHATTMLRFYYLQRIFSADFWHKLLSGRLDIAGSLQAFRQLLQTSLKRATAIDHSDKPITQAEQDSALALTPDQAVQTAIKIWLGLRVPLHLTLSGSDLTAAECSQLLQRTELRKIWHNIKRLEIPGANHTLSGEGHLEELMKDSVDFLRQLPE